MAFLADLSGYIRHWLVIPAHTAPYDGPAASETDLRKLTHVEPPGDAPRDADLGQPGPHDETWSFYDPGKNIFVEHSGFWHNLSVLDTYGHTHLVTSHACTCRARFWSCGVGDLWVNGAPVTRNYGTRYMYPDPVDVTLELAAGTNEISARVQALGIRDTRFLYGLQLIDIPEGIDIRIPGSED